ncbi:tyrosine-type recombinase/integrase [Acidisphaera rubrifaciens]|uniref:Integrase n=1 Tax=Acidisphaera rubrifaciens HS-AP3 TaxID=1231350 RepID=A0A0D6PA55_9PROT|nr:site-specific integrase [Acidisphaera rubrifaciens]GAN78093.1 integrase [Acidisphaera rubrifaciens HS-AP3]
MARTVRDANLETRTARARLKPAGKPYYRAIDEGLHLGYRKGKTAGKWVMRWYIGDQTYRTEAIATADDTLDADGAEVLTFAQAQAVARTRFVEQRRVAAGLPAKAGPYTVQLCMADYLTWLEHNRKTAQDARWRSDALILPILGYVECAKLTTKQLRDWRDAIAKAPARLRTKKNEQQKVKKTDPEEDPEEAQRRRRASVNRVLTILKAALNQAWREHKIPSDQAWRALTPFKQADAARVRHLTVEESRRIINGAQGAFRDLVKAALLTGARFSELGALQVADFNADAGTVHVRISKGGKGRQIVLTDEGVKFFSRLAAGRASRDRLLVKDDGGRWLKSHQSKPMAEACKAARLEPPCGFHTLRHTYASLAIMNGAPLMVVARNLGHVDTRMVEKHYGHLSASYVADAIRAAVPSFGITAETNVAAIGGAR